MVNSKTSPEPGEVFSFLVYLSLPLRKLSAQGQPVSVQDLPGQPDKQTGAHSTDDQIGDEAVRGKADEAKHKTTHKRADQTHDDIAQQTAFQTHQLTGDPADDGAHDQRTQHVGSSFPLRVVSIRYFPPVFKMYGDKINILSISCVFCFIFETCL